MCDNIVLIIFFAKPFRFVPVLNSIVVICVSLKVERDFLCMVCLLQFKGYIIIIIIVVVLETYIYIYIYIGT